MEKLTNCVVIEHQEVYLHWPRFKKLVEKVCQLDSEGEKHLITLSEFETYSLVFSYSELARKVNKDYREVMEAIRFLMLLPPHLNIAFTSLKQYILNIQFLQLDILEHSEKDARELEVTAKHQEALDIMAKLNMDSISYSNYLEKKADKIRFSIELSQEVKLQEVLKQQLANPFKSL